MFIFYTFFVLVLVTSVLALFSEKNDQDLQYEEGVDELNEKRLVI